MLALLLGDSSFALLEHLCGVTAGTGAIQDQTQCMGTARLEGRQEEGHSSSWSWKMSSEKKIPSHVMQQVCEASAAFEHCGRESYNNLH